MFNCYHYTNQLIVLNAGLDGPTTHWILASACPCGTLTTSVT